MTFTSDEVNFIVYRYLEESGFHHSAYLFGTESNIFNAGIDATMVPKGALLSIIQKGIFYTEAELFSIFPGDDLDSKLEKSVGSMTLIETIMPDGVRQKALNMKSPLCTPREGSSVNINSMNSSSAIDPSNLPQSRTPLSIASTSDGPGNAAFHEKQIKRERDIRGQQSVVNNLIVASSAGGGPANPGSTSTVPRGSYRHDLKSSTPAPSIATTSTAYGSSLPQASAAPNPSLVQTSSGFVQQLQQGSHPQQSQLTNHIQHSVSSSMIGVANPNVNGILPSSTSSSSGPALIQLERERESREASVGRGFLPNGNHLIQGAGAQLKMQIGGQPIGAAGGGRGAPNGGGGGGGGGAQATNPAATGTYTPGLLFGNNATRSF